MNTETKSTINVFEDIKKAHAEGKFSGPLADVIATFIYIIAHAFFRYLIERLIKNLLEVMQKHLANFVV